MPPSSPAALATPDSPVLLIGAPRSGSTFAARLLDTHPDILMTSETRVMIFASRMLRLVDDPWCIEAHKELFQKIAAQHCRRIVLEFYGWLNRSGAARWGDKFPHYADPARDPDCLPDIERLFPAAQFVHLVRDPRAVVRSILAKERELGVEPDLEEAIDVWLRSVGTSRSWGETVGADRFLECRFEDLIGSGERELARLLGFLGLEVSPEPLEFLRRQEADRTPFSAPTSPVTAKPFSLRPWIGDLETGQVARIEQATAELRVHYDYRDST